MTSSLTLSVKHPHKTYIKIFSRVSHSLCNLGTKCNIILSYQDLFGTHAEPLCSRACQPGSFWTHLKNETWHVKKLEDLYYFWKEAWWSTCSIDNEVFLQWRANESPKTTSVSLTPMLTQLCTSTHTTYIKPESQDHLGVLNVCLEPDKKQIFPLEYIHFCTVVDLHLPLWKTAI